MDWLATSATKDARTYSQVVMFVLVTYGGTGCQDVRVTESQCVRVILFVLVKLLVGLAIFSCLLVLPWRSSFSQHQMLPRSSSSALAINALWALCVIVV